MKIFKYPLAHTTTQQVEVPLDSVILTVQVQYGTPCLWAQVNDKNTNTEKRTIEIFGTGYPMSDDARQYIGTFQLADGQLVFHVFERL